MPLSWLGDFVGARTSSDFQSSVPCASLAGYRRRALVRFPAHEHSAHGLETRSSATLQNLRRRRWISPGPGRTSRVQRALLSSRAAPSDRRPTRVLRPDLHTTDAPAIVLSTLGHAAVALPL